MKDFEFSLPTKIIFGKNAQDKIGSMAASLGRRALIVYGSGRIIKNGLLDELQGHLKEAGVDSRPFGGVCENPVLSWVLEGVAQAKDFRADMVIAVGGGSVIDAAKAVCLGCCYDGDLWDIYSGQVIAQKALPLGVVLTNSATASEANGVSVLRKDNTGKKAALTCPLIRPAFALMNPELTYSVPPRQTAIGALDIFSHAFERYFHRGQRGTLRNLMCESVMKTVIIELPKALKSPENYDARSQLMWAGTVAHSDILGKEGVYACHAMSHILTARYNMPHGMALAILMPAWCKYVMVDHPQDIADFAVNVWGVEQNCESAANMAQEGISRFQQFVCNCGLPVTLREAGIGDADSKALTDLLFDGSGEDACIGENYEKMYRRDVQAMFDLAIG